MGSYVHQCHNWSEFYMPTFRNTLPHLHLPACEDGAECSKMSAYKIQTPGNYREESIQHSEHSEGFKSMSKESLKPQLA